MASLRKRNGKWQAQVRRTGHLPRARTFINRSAAILWIKQTESELDRAGITCDPGNLDRITAADIIERYKRDVTPSKRGFTSENKRLEVFLRQPWTKLTLSKLSPVAFNEYRERRLKDVAGATVRRELGLLQLDCPWFRGQSRASRRRTSNVPSGPFFTDRKPYPIPRVAPARYGSVPT